MTQAFVLGNGVSRQGLDLSALRRHGRIYGCNALYREFTPDVLVATDRPIALAIQESGYALTHEFYTRKPLDNFGAKKVPGAYYGYSSGPIAVALAAEHGAHTVYLLGFDMGGIDNKINNIYAGTEFYKRLDAPPIYSGNWIRQIIQIAQDYAHTEFVRVHGVATAEIEQFHTVPNLSARSLPEFVSSISN